MVTLKLPEGKQREKNHSFTYYSTTTLTNTKLWMYFLSNKDTDTKKDKVVQRPKFVHKTGNANHNTIVSIMLHASG